MRIEAGDIVRRWNKEYLVEQVYSVGRRYRKRHNLFFPHRVRIREMRNGFVTNYVDDFALTDNMTWEIVCKGYAKEGKR